MEHASKSVGKRQFGYVGNVRSRRGHERRRNPGVHRGTGRYHQRWCDALLRVLWEYMELGIEDGFADVGRKFRNSTFVRLDGNQDRRWRIQLQLERGWCMGVHAFGIVVDVRPAHHESDGIHVESVLGCVGEDIVRRQLDGDRWRRWRCSERRSRMDVPMVRIVVHVGRIETGSFRVDGMHQSRRQLGGSESKRRQSDHRMPESQRQRGCVLRVRSIGYDVESSGYGQHTLEHDRIRRVFRCCVFYVGFG